MAMRETTSTLHRWQILTAVFACASCVGPGIDAPSAATRGGVALGENPSPLRFSASTVSAPWCPGQRALVAQPVAMAGVTWRGPPNDQYTVYVGEELLPTEMYRVTPTTVTVCLPSAGDPKVLIFGPDSKGRPAQFDSTEAQRVS